MILNRDLFLQLEDQSYQILHNELRIGTCIPTHGTFMYRYSKFNIPKYFFFSTSISAKINILIVLDAQTSHFNK